MRTQQQLTGITLLGNSSTVTPTHYDPHLLEAFENQHADHDYLVTLDCPEFTTLCPKTGQPDFGHIIIRYIPGQQMVESKSLKLYLVSFRNNGDFHEDCINIIMRDLINLMQPRYIEVVGLFRPRGGISIIPFVNHADADHQSLKEARTLAFMNTTPSPNA